MRAGFALSVVLIVALSGCTSSETPEAERGSGGSAPAVDRPAGGEQAAPAPAAATAIPMAKGAPPTLVLPTRAPDPRHPETPCDRNEPGWVLKGNLVENGKCVVGPCDCIKE